MQFSNYSTWVFDLDNTLYSAETGIFDQVDKLMGEYIVKNLIIISAALVVGSSVRDES